MERNRLIKEEKLSELSIFLIVFLFFLIIFHLGPAITGFAVTMETRTPAESDSNDTYIRDGIYVDTTFGTSDPNVLKIGVESNGENLSSLLLFDIGNITSNLKITRAELFFNVFDVNNDTGLTAYIYRITENWNETNVTWNDRDFGGDGANGGGDDTAWATAGGTYNSDDYGSLEIEGTGNYSVNITSLVQGWVNESYDNYGLVIITKNITGMWKYIASANNETAAYRPKLEVDVNYNPYVLVTDPNGGETINETADGIYLIKFDVNDTDNHSLTANLYYSETALGKENTIVSNYILNITNCNSTNFINPVECNYTWNTSEFYGNYYLDVEVNDSYDTTLDSSDTSFDIVSLIDEINPNITNVSITSSLSSGEIALIRAKITDDRTLHSYWVEVNDTNNDITTTSMTLDTNNFYNLTFRVEENGTWGYIVYANDTLSNQNNSGWTSFTVSKPNATIQNELYPTSAQPLHVIKISAELNGTDLVTDVNATLNIDSDFSLLSDYPQTTVVGNISANGVGNVTWFLSTPQTESNYTFNVTFSDVFDNNWTTDNFGIDVTETTAMGTLVYITNYVEVEAGEDYVAEISVKDGDGNYVNADSNPEISLIDPLGDVSVGPTTSGITSLATGRYNYTKSTASSWTGGQWQILANVSKSSNYYEAREYFKITSGPFDVRDISVITNTVPTLSISVVLENQGGATKDMYVDWNLTRVDTGELLDSGAETVAVAGGSTLTHTVAPSTSYIGEVEIRFLGWYGTDFTERAGAYKTFTTLTSVSEAVVSPSATTKRGVETTKAKKVEKKTNLDIMKIEKTLEVMVGESKTVKLVVKNTGETTLHNINLNLVGLLNNWYDIRPTDLSYLNPGETGEFIIKIKLPEDIKDESYLFSYLIKSNEFFMEEGGELVVLTQVKLLLKEVNKLKDRLKDLQYTLDVSDKKGFDVFELNVLANLVDKDIASTKKLLEYDRIEDAKLNIESITNNLDKIERELGMMGVKVIKKPILPLFSNILWILTILLIGALVVILYLLYRKLHIINLFRWARPDYSRRFEAESLYQLKDDIISKVSGNKEKMKNIKKSVKKLRNKFKKRRASDFDLKMRELNRKLNRK